MPSGNLGFNPFYGTKDLTVAADRQLNSERGLQSFDTTLRKGAIADQNYQNKLVEENRNLKLNSLKSLYMQAYDNPSLAEKSAASMFSRIEGARDKNSINAIHQELESIREKAEDNKYLFDVAELGDSLLNWYGRTRGVVEGKDKLLKSKNIDLSESTKWLTPSDLITNIKSHINEVDYKSFGVNLLNSYGSPDELNKKLKQSLASPVAQNAFDDLLTTKLQDNFITRGNDFYREGPEAKQFQQQALNSLKNPDDLAKKYFKYDLENETIGSLRSAISSKLTELIVSPKSKDESVNKENDRLITSYRQSLELLDKRQKENATIYGVNKYEPDYERLGGKGRGGTANSLLSGVVDLSNAFSSRSDFEGTIYKKALYAPEVISYTPDGKPVMSNQFMYEKEDGSTGFNFGAIPEAGAAMISQMLPILSVGSVVGGVVGGAAKSIDAAAKLAEGYSTLNKVSAFGKELRMADRLSTFATVTAGTLPTMIAEEKKWGGNYFKRALAKAAVEGLTEGIGFPDVGALKFKPFQADLATSAKRAAGIELKFTDNARNFFNSAGQFGVIGLKQNAVEALEEELSLLGNAFLETTLMPEEFVGRDKTEITGESMLDTFVESFAAGAIYSGFTTGFQGYAAGNKSHVQNQADWEAANNPELFKAKLKQLNEKGSISDQQYAQAVLDVNRKSAVLNGLFGFDSIRDAKTLLEDKDEQYNYFINHLRADELVDINYDDLTDQEKQIFATRKLADKIDSKGRARMDEIRKELVGLHKEELSVENDKKIKELSKEYYAIRRANIKTINKKELTAEEEKFLKEKGIIGEKDFEYTQADIDAELSKVTTDILKTQKRIEKYANLSEEEKAKVISNAYDEKIASLDQITDPQELIQSRVNVQRDLDYLKLKGNYKDKAQIANRERLLDAYGERFDQLTNQRDESGRNFLEQSIENIDYDTLENTLDLYGITKLRNQIEDNSDFINQEMALTADENLAASQVRILEKLLTATPEERQSALAVFLDNVAPKNAMYAYNVEALNKQFPGIKFTVEELDIAREALIQRRSEMKAQEIAGQPVTEEGLTDEENADVEEFSSMVNTASTPSTPSTTPASSTTSSPTQPIDESGKSQTKLTFKEGYAKQVSDYKKKYPTDYINKFKEFLINIVARKFGRGTRDFDYIVGLVNSLFNKSITISQFEQSIASMADIISKDIAARKRNKTNSDTAENKLASLNAVSYFAKRFVREELPTTAASAPVVAATPVANPLPANLNTETKNKALDAQLARREARLLELNSPLRSAAIEFDSKDIRRTDPAEVRNAKAIESLGGPGAQIRIQSRKGTAMVFLAMKYPDKTEEQIDEDFRRIESIFENNSMTIEQWNALTREQQDAILAPMHELLGEEYFDRSTLGYFIVNKGDGFTVNSAVMITAPNQEEGSLSLFDGYPLQLNLTKLVSKGKDVVFPEEHSKTLQDVKRLRTFLTENPYSFVDTEFSVSEGVLPKSASQKKAAEIENETIAQSNASDFEIADSEGQEIFGKTFKFNLGRIYFNNNGNPVILGNTNIQEQEAEAIAEMIFSETIPSDFVDQAGLEKYLFSLINIIDKKNRVHFFPNNNYPSKSEAVEYPLTVVQTTYVNGKPVNKILTKEEFLDFLRKSFYKADRTILQNGDPMIRVSLVDGKIVTTKQSYSDYLKDTHTFPVTAGGELITPINKVVYPDQKEFEKKVLEVLPKTQPTPPQVQPSVLSPSVSTSTNQPEAVDLHLVQHAKLKEVVEKNPILNSLFKGAYDNLTPELYDQLVQFIYDNPGKVTYNSIEYTDSSKSAYGIVPYTTDSNPIFIFVGIQLPGREKPFPLVMLSNDDLEVRGIDKKSIQLTMPKQNTAPVISKTLPQQPIDTTPAEPEITSKQSLIDNLNSQSAGEMFDQDDIDQAKKAKEDCAGLDRAKQLKEIKKKPKL